MRGVIAENIIVFAFPKDIAVTYEEKLKRIEEKSTFPKVLNIETTNFCNLTCPMCARTTSMTRPTKHMEFETFKKVVGEAAEHGVKGVWLHVFGEPIMHPHNGEFIRHIKSFKTIKTVGLSSNVTLLNEKQARDILTSGLDRIILSIDASSKDTYKKIRGWDYEKTTDNVGLFLRVRKELGANIFVQVSIIDMVYNHGEIEEFRKKWTPLLDEGDQLLVKPFINFGNQVSNLDGKRAEEAKRKVPCRKLWNSLTILSNGDVVACCYDVNGVLRMGNIIENSLASIWRGSALKRFRDIHMSKDFSPLPICANCSATDEPGDGA